MFTYLLSHSALITLGYMLQDVMLCQCISIPPEFTKILRVTLQYLNSPLLYVEFHTQSSRSCLL